MNSDILHLFTDHVRASLTGAIDLAYQRREDEVMPIVLFVSLSMQKGCLAQEILAQFDLSVEHIAELMPEPGNGDLPLFLPAFTKESKQCIERAAVIAKKSEHHHIGTEHLLSALLQQGDPIIEAVLKKHGLTVDQVMAPLNHIFGAGTKLVHIQSMSQKPGTPHSHQHPMNNTTTTKTGTRAQDTAQQATPALDFFAKDLTADGVAETLDSVIGREQEIDRAIHILSRRNKNNPVLIGDPGVGKTAIVEGLAKRITEGRVPDALLHKRVMALDLSALLAGSMYRGEFEGRIKQIVDELRANKDIIVFIDEIHMLVGAGGTQGGTMDAANMLKPALAKGDIRCIGATTREEYRKHIEHDAALERRFQPIVVSEPSEADTVAILRGIKKYYETYHHAVYSDDALVAAVRWSMRYIPEKYLPDKAIDLIDEAGARARVNEIVPEPLKQFEKLQRRFARLVSDKETAVHSEQLQEALELKERSEAIDRELQKLETQVRALKLPVVEITEEDIARVIEKMRGIPVAQILGSGGAHIQALEKRLNAAVIGQPEAVHDVVSVIKRSAAGLNTQKRPLGSFLFCGPSGVGKTLLAQKIAEYHFGDPDALIRIDMSEFSEGFTVSKLLGAPAGYVGHNDTVPFTEEVRKRPYSVVLFDEIEKAHPDIYNVLLQILDEGTVTDNTGRVIHFHNTIIILTTNVGVPLLNQQAGLGFDVEVHGGKTDSELMKKDRLQSMMKELLQDTFPREFLNRIDYRLLFEALSPADMAKIVSLELKELVERLKHLGMKCVITPAVKKHLGVMSFEADSGARRVRQQIANVIEEPLADALLKFQSSSKGSAARIVHIDLNSKKSVTIKIE